MQNPQLLRQVLFRPRRLAGPRPTSCRGQLSLERPLSLGDVVALFLQNALLLCHIFLGLPGLAQPFAAGLFGGVFLRLQDLQGLQLARELVCLDLQQARLFLQLLTTVFLSLQVLDHLLFSCELVGLRLQGALHFRQRLVCLDLLCHLQPFAASCLNQLSLERPLSLGDFVGLFLQNALLLRQAFLGLPGLAQPFATGFLGGALLRLQGLQGLQLARELVCLDLQQALLFPQLIHPLLLFEADLGLPGLLAPFAASALRRCFGSCFPLRLLLLLRQLERLQPVLPIPKA